MLQQVGGCRGGGYAVDEESPWDAARACEASVGGQFVFDVPTHHVDAGGGGAVALRGQFGHDRAELPETRGDRQGRAAERGGR